MKLDSKTYNLDALKLAPELIGKLLCRSVNDKIIKLRITETESYFGKDDTACHAHKGKTKRNEVMFQPGGKAYIYLCYGMHNLLNIVSGKDNNPEAVLIRGGIILDNSCPSAEINHKSSYKNLMLDGPGKITKFLNIDRTLNEEDLSTSSRLWIEDDRFKCLYTQLKRVGISYASEEYRNKLWRFRAENF